LIGDVSNFADESRKPHLKDISYILIAVFVAVNAEFYGREAGRCKRASSNGRINTAAS
jgi:hypothetical protein